VDQQDGDEDVFGVEGQAPDDARADLAAVPPS